MGVDSSMYTFGICLNKVNDRYVVGETFINVVYSYIIAHFFSFCRSYGTAWLLQDAWRDTWRDA